MDTIVPLSRACANTEAAGCAETDEGDEDECACANTEAACAETDGGDERRAAASEITAAELIDSAASLASWDLTSEEGDKVTIELVIRSQLGTAADS